MQENFTSNKANPGIRFASGEHLQFFKTLRERVDGYFSSNHISPKANSSMIVKTFVLLAAYILPYVLLLVYTPPASIAWMLWVVMGLALAGIGMSVMHDANHGAYSENERTNQLIGLSLNMLGGTVLNWKMQHNTLHHTYTNITGLDEDIDTKLIIRLSPHAEARPIHKNQWFYAFGLYALLTLYWALLKDLVQYLQYKKSGLNKRKSNVNTAWLIRVSIMKLVYFFMMLGLPTMMGIPFWQVLAGFLIMNALAGVILSVVFQMAHTVEETAFPMPDKDGNMEDSWAVHQLKTTMNFSRNNKWLSWYVGGLNFQVEHHLFSRICHVHYPAISEIVKSTAHEFNVPYLEKENFIDAFKSHVRLLKKQGLPNLNEIMG